MWFRAAPPCRRSAVAIQFRNREAAGRDLALRLSHLRSCNPVVLALPRGGVPVGLPIARALAAPLDVLLVRKIGAPGNAEFGIGAVADGEPPVIWIDQQIVRSLGIGRDYIERKSAEELAEIVRRRALYRHGCAPLPVVGRTAIVVDDGIATGGTARAALQALARAGASRRVLAIPVAPSDSAAALRELSDEAVFLLTPDGFGSVGWFYDDFRQVEDDAVVALLDKAENLRASSARAPERDATTPTDSP